MTVASRKKGRTSDAPAGPPFPADPHLAVAGDADPRRRADPGAVGHPAGIRRASTPGACSRTSSAAIPEDFQERHYSEFVTFLPYVRRFLYGEGPSRGGAVKGAESPLRVFRRNDIAKVRMTFPEPGSEPVIFDVAHVDLYFLYDIDVVTLVVEIFADDLSLTRAQDAMYRFGRAYPTYWAEGGRGGHCVMLAEWLGADGSVLAVSDYEERQKVPALRRTRIARPTTRLTGRYLLRPLVPDYSDEKGLIRFRQIEYARMPLMAYLAMDDARAVTRADFVRLGLVTGPGRSDVLPYSRALHARLRGPLLLRPVLERGAQRTSRHALHVMRPRLRHGRRRRRSVLRRPRSRPAGTVSPSIFHLVPDPAHPQGHAADAVRSDGQRAEQALDRGSGFGPPVQANDPPAARDLPALHPPLLVPRSIGPAAGDASSTG